MPDGAGPLEAADDGVVVRVHVQPGASRPAVAGRHGDALKLKVAAPPVDGRANDAVVALLAATFGVRPGRVVLLSGAGSRSKRLLVRDVSLARAEAVLGGLGAL